MPPLPSQILHKRILSSLLPHGLCALSSTLQPPRGHCAPGRVCPLHCAAKDGLCPSGQISITQIPQRQTCTWTLVHLFHIFCLLPLPRTKAEALLHHLLPQKKKKVFDLQTSADVFKLCSKVHYQFSLGWHSGVNPQSQTLPARGAENILWFYKMGQCSLQR